MSSSKILVDLPVTFSHGQVKDFAAVSGDTNPIHLIKGYLPKLEGPIVHGALLLSFVAGLIAGKMQGCMILETSAKFRRYVSVDEEVYITITFEKEVPSLLLTTLSFVVRNKDDARMVSGEFLIRKL